MTVARAAAWDANNFQDPTGTIPPESGSNRLLVVLQLTEFGGGFSTSTFTIGGQTFTTQYTSFLEVGNEDTQVDYYIWNETAIAAMSGSTVSYTDDQTLVDTMFTYATFTGVRQVTPATNTIATSTSSDSEDIVTTSNGSDYIICASARAVVTRDITDWDTLAEIFDTGANNFRQSMADGAGGDDTTTVTGDGTADDINLSALVIHSLGSVIFRRRR